MSDEMTTHLSSDQAAELLRKRLSGRIRELRVLICEGSVVLQGWTLTYYEKQLAQHAAMRVLRLPIRANEIKVRKLLEATH